MAKRNLKSIIGQHYFDYIINGYERCCIEFFRSMRTIGTEEGDTIHIVSVKYYYMNPSISDIGLINKATIYNKSSNVRKTCRYYNSYKYKDIAKMSQFKGR